MRKVIQISDGIHLCDDGTMWKKLAAKWEQLDNVPQPKTDYRKIDVEALDAIYGSGFSDTLKENLEALVLCRPDVPTPKGPLNESCASLLMRLKNV